MRGRADLRRGPVFLVYTPMQPFRALLSRSPLARLTRGERIVAAVYAVLAVALWPSPLLGLLHVESSAVVAGVAFVASGLASVTAFGQGRALGATLGRHLLLLAVPWALLTLSLLWRANCGYGQGFLLFGLFVPPGVVLAVALAWALAGTRLRRPRLVFVLLTLGVAVVPILTDLGFHPQFYTYNHVWGGVLGPIYDEELALRPGLVAFRALTLLWAALALLVGAWLRGGGKKVARGGALVAVCLGVAYLLGGRLGIVTDAATIERRLPGRLATPRVVLHYSPADLPCADRRVIARELDYRFVRLRERLGTAPRTRVHVYLYPDADVRAALTGARYVSVTPVWLARPQMHLLQTEATPDVLGHELVHVFAREFGLPVLKASPAVGLVEGIAVALEPPDGLPSPTEQVAASWHLSAEEAGGLAEGPAAAVSHTMSPLGFWTGRGAVSYTTTGAFCGWLLDRSGAAPLRRAYRTGGFGAYGRSVERLAAEWEEGLRRVPVTPEAEAVAAWRFSRPSLFERRCPHFIPLAVRHARTAARRWEEGDAPGALASYAAMLAVAPDDHAGLVGWSRAALAVGRRPVEVARRLYPATRRDTVGDAALALAMGDALGLAGDTARARRWYDHALRVLPPFAHEARALITLRLRLTSEELEALLQPDPAEERARRIPVSSPLRALLYQEAGHYEAAYRALHAVPPDADGDVERQRLTWLAELAWRTGRMATARNTAQEAARAWTAVGQDGPARALRDLALKAGWYAARQTATVDRL